MIDDQLAGADVEVDALEDVQPVGADRVALVEPAQAQHRHLAVRYGGRPRHARSHVRVLRRGGCKGYVAPAAGSWRGRE